MLATMLRGSTSSLCRCVVAPLLVQRFYGVRPNFCDVSSQSTHPEWRRTVPEVYVNGLMERHRDSEVDVNVRRHLVKKYRKALMKHPQHKDHRCYTDQYRWAEFRRKLIYGNYNF